MGTIDFDSKAARYEQDGLVQKAASDILLGLLSIQPGECVLDAGCGSGGVTARIAAMTGCSVLGIDASEGMIRTARTSFQAFNLDFEVVPAEAALFNSEWDVVFCNSAFQWFSPVEDAVRSLFQALRPGGRLGVQAPATNRYCPQFLTALDEVKARPETRKTFSRFHSPFFFLDSAEAYQALFERAGFAVQHCELRTEHTRFTLDEAYRVFQSGAENGYLNQAFYDAPVTDAYISAFRETIQAAFAAQADSEGRVTLAFTRLYFVGRRP